MRSPGSTCDIDFVAIKEVILCKYVEHRAWTQLRGSVAGNRLLGVSGLLCFYYHGNDPGLLEVTVYLFWSESFLEKVFCGTAVDRALSQMDITSCLFKASPNNVLPGVNVEPSGTSWARCLWFPSSGPLCPATPGPLQWPVSSILWVWVFGPTIGSVVHRRLLCYQLNEMQNTLLIPINGALACQGTCHLCQETGNPASGVHWTWSQQGNLTYFSPTLRNIDGLLFILTL